MVPEALAGAPHVFADATLRGDKPRLDPGWSAITDRVMGGVSDVRLSHEEVEGRHAWRLRGRVRLENNGGFIQMRTPVEQDLTKRSGAWFDLRGNGEAYVLSLRTADIRRPWQSYRAVVAAPPDWTRVELKWSDFKPYRIDAPLDVATIRSVHLLGVGRAFEADVALAAMGWL